MTIRGKKVGDACHKSARHLKRRSSGFGFDVGAWASFVIGDRLELVREAEKRPQVAVKVRIVFHKSRKLCPHTRVRFEGAAVGLE